MYFSGTTTEISDATDDRTSAEEISLDGDVKDVRQKRARPKSSRKEHVVLGRRTLAEVWVDMSKTTLPSWIGRAPPRLGDGRHGKLSADQWRTACTVNLVVTLVRLWGLKSPNDRHYQMLDNFMDLVTACKLAMMRKTTPDRIEQFQKHMHRYLETTKKLYVYSALTPNHHLSLHLPRLFENFGPPHAWVCFVFERCLRWLKFIKTSNKFGELEQTLLTRFCMSQDIRVLMQSTTLPPILSDLQLAFSKALDGDTRGTFWNDLWAFSPSADESFSVLERSKEVPLPRWIKERLAKGALGGIAAKHYPQMCFSQDSLTSRGMQFSIAKNSLGNSYVVFKRKAESDKSWSAGSIQMIFHLQIEEEMHGPFFTIKPYLPLNTLDLKFDPYQIFLFAAGQLVYEECGDEVVCVLDEVLCHFAHTPYSSPEIPKPCVHVLPLDRVCACLLSSQSFRE
ncbi:hypothetical protein H4582DRAFT_1818464 [Lactarius indigo]|nr:hypothetical protein H4582DRAFT_1818578 [Lactarius indigo]KAI9434628.1 hypothetical protein H4582DRAFT_1818464 [Lactarius indigo]